MMKRFAFPLLSLLMLPACSTDIPLEPSSVAGPAPQASTQAESPSGATSATAETTSLMFPLPQPFHRPVPCAAGGLGEIVALNGTLHMVMHTTLDGRGGFHARFLVHPRGVTGVGLTTGDIYQGTGGTQTQLNGNVGEETAFIDNFRLLGQGPGNNFLLHQTFHVTVNANGETTASVSNFSVECR